VEIFTNWPTWERTEPELRRLLPPSTCDAVAKAVDFAVHYHGDQKRPTGAPYVEHLLEALEVLVRGAGVGDADVLCAAVLHDVVEDTPCTLDEVRAAFGERVAEMVGWVTKPEEAEGEDRKAVKEAYLAGLADAPQDAILVKLADQASNVQCCARSRCQSSGSTTGRPWTTSCRSRRHGVGGVSGTRAGKKLTGISASRSSSVALRPATTASSQIASVAG
jgi:(p)ppGpp synthase/HD superfamily hydrolase